MMYDGMPTSCQCRPAIEISRLASHQCNLADLKTKLGFGKTSQIRHWFEMESEILARRHQLAIITIL